jgi:hypothetical protein
MFGPYEGTSSQAIADAMMTILKYGYLSVIKPHPFFDPSRRCPWKINRLHSVLP